MIKSEPRNDTKCNRLICCVVTTLLASNFIPVQTQQPTSREIIAEDFIRNRPKVQSNQPQRNKRVYRPARSSVSNDADSKPFSNKPGGTSTVAEQLGITFWRLRPARAIDTGARMLVQEGSRSSEWVPERLEAETPIKIGDLVRITIESPRTGYLYVVDRELYADGTKGEAMLIFPTRTTRNGDNSVLSGRLIDIPGQADPPFRTTKSRDDHVGELLTILVTSKPLDLPISDTALPLSVAEIERWEAAWATPVEQFEMVGGAGQTWTKEEKEASAGTTSRQLTQADPVPQTIYRVLTKNKTAFLVSLRLNYRTDRQ